MKHLFAALVISAAFTSHAFSAGNGAAAGILQDGERRLAPSTNTEERRLALVIGNDEYPKTPLKNAVNDAKSIEAALQADGFTVRLALNTTRAALEDAISGYLDTVRSGDVALIYYSGHGIQIDNQNYLIPVDFTADTPAKARHQAYSASDLIDSLQERGARLNILVLDACRDNPFGPGRSLSGGLAAMNAGRGTYIAFATAPGRTASDNQSGVNGLFTGFLVHQLRKPGLTLDEVFTHVREKVMENSNDAQVPWSASSVVGSFIFRLPSGPLQAKPNFILANTQLDPKKILQQFTTLFIEVEKNRFFDRAELQTSLAGNEKFAKLRITIVDEKEKAEVVLSVAATAVAGYPFQLIDRESDNVLDNGWGMGVWPKVSRGVAKDVVKILMPYRKDSLIGNQTGGL